MKNKLTWLHISDIHFHPSTEWRDSSSRKGLINLLQQKFEFKKLPHPDFIFCTGDIAFGESKSTPLSKQYKQAECFFSELLKVCGQHDNPLHKDRLYVVPGNHDVNRNSINEDIQKILTLEAKSTTSEYSEILNKRFEKQPNEFADIIKRLDEYGDFTKAYLPHQFDSNGRHHYAKIEEINDLKIGIAGFNSAWTCSGPEDDRTIWLASEWQFNSAYRDLESVDIRIGLIHHPVDWICLADRTVATKRISTDFHFWLHGHTHDQWLIPTENHITIAAGAVGASQSEEFGVNLVQIDLETKQGAAFFFQHKSGDRGWTVSPIDEHAPNGKWSFSLPISICKEKTIKEIKRTIDKKKVDIVESSFVAQLGCSNKKGLFTDEERLDSLRVDKNPYVTGSPLKANSSVFFGRKNDLHKMYNNVNASERPNSISLLGETKVGKSSLLNQLYTQLSKEKNLISIQTSTQNWDQMNAEGFFMALHHCIASLLNLDIDEDNKSNYDKCRNFISSLAKENQYRFILIIDDFEKMSDNPKFNTDFFTHLRGFGETPEYRFGFVVSSCIQLEKLCHQKKIESSRFWNIFGTKITLGLLDEKSAENLFLTPLKRTLDHSCPKELYKHFEEMMGHHPYLIQLVASDYWSSVYGSFPIDKNEIKINLHQYLKYWFYQQSKENYKKWEIMVKSAGNQQQEALGVFNELCSRGLILKNGELFCPYFSQVIKDEFFEINKQDKESFEDMQLKMGDHFETTSPLYERFLEKIKGSINEN